MKSVVLGCPAKSGEISVIRRSFLLRSLLLDHGLREGDGKRGGKEPATDQISTCRVRFSPGRGKSASGARAVTRETDAESHTPEALGMLAHIFPRIYIGDVLACSRGMQTAGHTLLAEPHVTAHACKDPCHKVAVGYAQSLSPSHPHYLVKEQPSDLFLNMIDPATPLFKHELFWSTLSFVRKHIDRVPVVIHCNQGLSRSVSLAMVYGAHRRLCDCDPYDFHACMADMITRLPVFSPGLGIRSYMEAHWKELVDGRIPPEAA